MISMFASLRRHHVVMNSMMGTHSRRLFASGSTSKLNAPGDEYQAYEENVYYSPVRKLNFQSGRATIFHQDVTPG